MSSGPGKNLNVVLDTNVLISALGFRKKTARVWELAEEGRFDLFVSTFILAEFERVLVEKLGLTPDKAAALVEGVSDVAQAVEVPARRLSVIKADDADNAVLECAVEARADVIVSGDLRHVRPLGAFRGIEILTPREFLDKYFPLN